jgi:hypothetical protein
MRPRRDTSPHSSIHRVAFIHRPTFHPGRVGRLCDTAYRQ